MNSRALRISLSVLIIALIGYFYSLQFIKNSSELSKYKLTVDGCYLSLSLVLFIASYLIETVVWKKAIDKLSAEKGLTFYESIAVVNASGLLKYLPGRIWMYTAQLVWLKKYGISKSKVLYVNFIGLIASITVSLYFGIAYLFFYAEGLNKNVIIASAAALVSGNILYLLYNLKLVNWLMSLANRFLKKSIAPLSNSAGFLLFIQFAYLCSWLTAGLAGFLMLKGVGLNVSSENVFALLASMSFAWVAGYLAVVSPGGLGIREAMMLIMLTQVVDVQVAMLFPLLSRAMMLVAELLLGGVGFLLGLKYKIFTRESVSNEMEHSPGEV